MDFSSTKDFFIRRFLCEQSVVFALYGALIHPFLDSLGTSRHPIHDLLFVDHDAVRAFNFERVAALPHPVSREGKGNFLLGNSQDFAFSAFLTRIATTTHLSSIFASPSRQPQDDIAVALPGAAQLGQPADELAVEPVADHGPGWEWVLP